MNSFDNVQSDELQVQPTSRDWAELEKWLDSVLEPLELPDADSYCELYDAPLTLPEDL